MIRDYGILNDQLEPNDAFLYGLPYPGVFVCDEDGVVVAKFFHDTYKKRESAHTLIDTALGQILLRSGEPSSSGGDEDVRVSVTLHGGSGAIKQGAIRRVVTRFELREGLHIYGEPVPEGMVATQVTIEGPDGLIVGDPQVPPTKPLRLEGLDVELQVWSGTVDVVTPIYALSRLASELRPLEEGASLGIEVTVRYQACDDVSCLAPRNEKHTLNLPIEPIDVPSLALFKGNGQRETAMDSPRHLRRLFLRKLRTHPIKLMRFIGKNIRLELAARRRARARSDG